MEILLNINDSEYLVDCDYDDKLLDVLRNQIGLCGTKEGCREGECGACTIIIDNKAINACIVFAHGVVGKKIYTIESLEKNGELDKIQTAFVDNGAIQCGFCTPGMIMSIKALLLENEKPSEEEVRKAIEGNLCRCTGYQNIVEAVKSIT